MIEIREGELDHPAVAELLRVHLDEVRANPTPGGAHVLDRIGLKAANIRFFTAWQDGALLGCAAIKQLGAGEAEIKSMRTAPDQLRRGTGAALVGHLLKVARESGLRRLYLETGATPEFEAAQALYRQFGFTFCPRFGDYADTPLSKFMSRTL